MMMMMMMICRVTFLVLLSTYSFVSVAMINMNLGHLMITVGIVTAI